MNNRSADLVSPTKLGERRQISSKSNSMVNLTLTTKTKVLQKTKSNPSGM